MNLFNRTKENLIIMNGKGVLFRGFNWIIRSSFGTGLGKNQTIRKITNYLIKQISPDFVEVEGNKMIINSLDNLYLALYGKHEEFESKCVKKVIKKGDCVLDIGANQGYFSLFFAKLVGENGRIISFEPDSENCKIIEKNIELNNYHNIELNQKAVSNQTGKINMYVGNYRTGNRIYESDKNRVVIKIESIKLDDFFKDFKNNINFIKIDVEGAEFSVIQGMDEFLKNNKEIIIMSEFFPSLIKKFGKEPIEYLNFLIEKKFTVFHMDEKDHLLKPLNINKILKEFTPEKENWTNLLCFKGNEEIIKKIVGFGNIMDE